MSPHPCDGHPCDHCYLCDVVGICCQTVATGQRVLPTVQNPVPANVLHDAIIREAGTIPSLRELLRLDAQRQRPVGLLAKPLVLPSTAAEHISNDSRKEAIHVHAARNAQ
jgi:hypothetical protein